MNFLRQKTIFNTKLFKDFLQLYDQLRSAAALVPIVLKVYGMGDIKTHVHLVHINNILHQHTVARPPVFRLALQVPDRNTAALIPDQT